LTLDDIEGQYCNRNCMGCSASSQTKRFIVRKKLRSLWRYVAQSRVMASPYVASSGRQTFKYCKILGDCSTVHRHRPSSSGRRCSCLKQSASAFSAAVFRFILMLISSPILCTDCTDQ